MIFCLTPYLFEMNTFTSEFLSANYLSTFNTFTELVTMNNFATKLIWVLNSLHKVKKEQSTLCLLHVFGLKGNGQEGI